MPQNASEFSCVFLSSLLGLISTEAATCTATSTSSNLLQKPKGAVLCELRGA